VIYFVYVLSSKIRNYIYVGLTGNPDVRIRQHQKGAVKTTRAYRPFDLLLLENLETRIEARKHEKYLKSGIGKEFLRSLKKNRKAETN